MIDDAQERLAPRLRELLDRIVERPGGGPRDYADDPRSANSVHRVSDRAGKLERLGLIERTGTPQARRYWLAGEVPDGEVPARVGPPIGTGTPPHRRAVEQIERGTAELIAIIEQQQQQLAEAHAAQRQLEKIRRQIG